MDSPQDVAAEPTAPMEYPAPSSSQPAVNSSHMFSDNGYDYGSGDEDFSDGSAHHHDGYDFCSDFDTQADVYESLEPQAPKVCCSISTLLDER
jgi:hypothetical protein